MAIGLAANLTKGIGREVKTAFALANLGAGRKECVSELLDLILGLVQQIQGKPFGRARANARQTLELIN